MVEYAVVVDGAVRLPNRVAARGDEVEAINMKALARRMPSALRAAGVRKAQTEAYLEETQQCEAQYGEDAAALQRALQAPAVARGRWNMRRAPRSTPALVSAMKSTLRSIRDHEAPDVLKALPQGPFTGGYEGRAAAVEVTALKEWAASAAEVKKLIVEAFDAAMKLDEENGAELKQARFLHLQVEGAESRVVSLIYETTYFPFSVPDTMTLYPYNAERAKNKLWALKHRLAELWTVIAKVRRPISRCVM